MILLVGTLHFALVDSFDDVVGVLVVNSATNGLAGTKNFLDCAGKLLGQTLVTHFTCNVEDCVQVDVAVVFDVLDLLPVTVRLIQGLDDQGGGGRDDRASGLPVLASQLHCDLQALPLLGGLGNVVTDLLGRHSQGSQLGRDGSASRGLATRTSDVQVLHFRGVHFGSHFGSV